MVYETCALLHLNEDDDDVDNHEHDIFSTEDRDGPFFDFLYATVGIIVGILVGGGVYEVVRRSKKRTTIPEDDVVTNSAVHL